MARSNTIQPPKGGKGPAPKGKGITIAIGVAPKVAPADKGKGLPALPPGFPPGPVMPLPGKPKMPKGMK